MTTNFFGDDPKILREGKDIKERRATVKDLMGLNLRDLEMGIKLQLIQELIPLGLIHVRNILLDIEPRLNRING